MAAPAAPGLTAVIDTAVDAVRLTVTPATGSTVLNLWRTGPSGVVAGVRSSYPRQLESTAPLTIRDYEAPIGVPVVYYATTDASDGSTSPPATTTVTIPDLGCSDTWLTDLARAQNTQRVTIEALDELDYEIPAGVHRILGRRTPIVTSDVAFTPNFELAFLTETERARDQARAALGNGIPVLLRTPPANGIGNMYMAVLGWQEQRIVKAATVPDRRFVVSCAQVDRPDPRLYQPLAPTIYQGVEDRYATYADVAAANASYDALLYDYAATVPGDIIAWPPDDV